MEQLSYDYLPLPLCNHIRLLDLKSDTSQAQLEASLFNCRIDDASVRPSYTAVSYVWGDTTRVDTILIDGINFGITKSAAEVLRRLRQPDVVVTVWLDAICINQQDITERENQVSFMHQIYAYAARTFVWLGPATDDSDLAMQYVEQLDWQKFNEEQRLSLGLRHDRSRKTFLLEDSINDQVSRAVMRACCDLIARNWFSRAWVQQEATVCRNTIVACGEMEVSWDHLFALAWLMTEKWTIRWPLWLAIERWNAFEQHRNIILTIQELRQAHSFVNANPSVPPPFPDKASFLYLLYSMSRMTSATDPRDKLYALRNMASESRYVPRPNYRISWQELYIEVARDIMKSSIAGFMPLECTMLLRAGVANQELGYQLPSWIPDWRSNEVIPFPQHDKWFAGGSEAPKYVFQTLSKKQRFAILKSLDLGNSQEACYKFSNRSLSLQLVSRMLDEIVGLSDADWELNDHDPYSKTSESLLSLDQDALRMVTGVSDRHYVTGQLLEDAYAHVLIAGTGFHDAQANHVSALAEATQWRSWLRDGCVEDPPEFELYIEQSLVFRQRKVCLTQHNLLGLVPSTSQRGDFIAIMRSLKHPVVLRPVTDSQYLLIGECYIHGFMDNQASLLIEEHNIKVDKFGNQTFRPEGDIRRNGLSTPSQVCHGDWLDNSAASDISIAKYKELIPILGERWITMV